MAEYIPEWLRNYKQASFRGVEFFVPGHEGRGGRRHQVTEFPGRDTPHIEDLGRKVKTFSIEAYVIGDSYHIQRNLLITALDKKGPGKLVHPYLGDMQIAVPDYTWRDTVQEGGMARFSITCIEAGELRFPTKVVDTVTKVATAKQSSLDALQVWFEKVWKISRVPKTVADAALDTVDKGFALMQSDKSAVSSIASFRRDIQNVRGNLIAIAYDAAELMENTIGLMRLGTDDTSDEIDVTSETGKQSFEDLKPLTVYQSTDIISGDEDEPAKVYAEVYQASAIINMAGLLSIIEFESAETAEEFRDLVYARLDAIMETVSDDSIYNALYELRSSTAEHIDSKIRNLPRRAEYVPIVSLPAILISYNVYGTISRETEIIKRNKISHPAFVSGSVPIEVLIDVE